MDGFLQTRASIMLDVVFLAMFAVVPLLGWSIHLVRNRRNYALHKRVQLTLGILLLVAVTLFELDMRFFTNRRFTAANSAITLTFFAMFGSMFLMTQYWQFVHGYSALSAGARMVPFAITMMVFAPTSARIVA